ncbi:MAG TPA: response regulator [Lysobacter sp.]
MGGKTLLLAEDEMYVAMTLSDLLTEAGYRVFTAARLGDAIGVAERERIDCAILDINLHGEQVYPLCERLQESGVPFFFTSAYGTEGLAERYRDVPMVPKPYTCDEVVEAIVQQLGEGEGG